MSVAKHFLVLIEMATVEGTLLFKSKHLGMKYTKIPKLNLSVSRLALGTFRLTNELKTKQLVQAAINMGYNLFDTASNFGMGQNERFLGKALNELIQEKRIDRSNIVVINKIGYKPKTAPKFPNTFNINRIDYCIDPQFLEYQITSSLKQMGLSSIDVLMLNNPERLLNASSVNTLEAIEKALNHLELEVSRGRIGSFGITSNTMALPNTPDFLKVGKFMDRNNMAAIEYPLNIFEPEAVIDESIGLYQQCIKSDIFQVSQRPFLAITPIGVHKLAASGLVKTEAQVNKLVKDSFTSVNDLEYILGSKGLFRLISKRSG